MVSRSSVPSICRVSRLLTKKDPCAIARWRFIFAFPLLLIVCLLERSALALQEPQKPRKIDVFAIFFGPKSRQAQRNKHVGPNAGRKVGDPIIEDAALDAKKYVEMMTQLVFPAIRKAYAGEEVVYVQRAQAAARNHARTEEV